MPKPDRTTADTVLDELRSSGWAVAVHNDYRIGTEAFTFWLLTHPNGRYVKGEGCNDLSALIGCRDQIAHSMDGRLPHPDAGVASERQRARTEGQREMMQRAALAVIQSCPGASEAARKLLGDAAEAVLALEIERAGAATERTAKDYAVEFGRYLAAAAARYQIAVNAYHKACASDREGNALAAMTEAYTRLSSAIYEFRKRVERANG